MGNPLVWDPKDYAANSSAQLRSGRRLLARLGLRGRETVLDLGCGDGIREEFGRHDTYFGFKIYLTTHIID